MKYTVGSLENLSKIYFIIEFEPQCENNCTPDIFDEPEYQNLVLGYLFVSQNICKKRWLVNLLGMPSRCIGFNKIVYRLRCGIVSKKM